MQVFCTFLFSSLELNKQFDRKYFQKPIDKWNLVRYNTDKPTNQVGFQIIKGARICMKNYFLELLRRNFRFGRMCYSRTDHMAGCLIAPMVPLL